MPVGSGNGLTLNSHPYERRVRHPASAEKRRGKEEGPPGNPAGLGWLDVAERREILRCAQNDSQRKGLDVVIQVESKWRIENT
jgi:hypothetical protein